MGAADSTLDARARSSRVPEPDSPLRTTSRALTPGMVAGFLGIATLVTRSVSAVVYLIKSFGAD